MTLFFELLLVFLYAILSAICIHNTLSFKPEFEKTFPAELRPPTALYIGVCLFLVFVVFASAGLTSALACWLIELATNLI